MGYFTEQIGQIGGLTLLSCVLGVHFSNLGCNFGYDDCGFGGFLQFFQANAGIVTEDYVTTASFHTLSVHYSRLSTYLMLYGLELLAVSLNQLQINNTKNNIFAAYVFSVFMTI